MRKIWQFLGLAEETIGRGRYALVNTILAIPLVVTYLVFTSADSPIVSAPLAFSVFGWFIVLLVFYLIVYWKSTTLRVRDIGIAIGWRILAIVPWINIPFFIFLCLKRGRNNPGPLSPLVKQSVARVQDASRPVKDNLQKMEPFQRYLLILGGFIGLLLVVITIVLAFKQ